MIALYPGAFKPPHRGHFNVIKSLLDGSYSGAIYDKDNYKETGAALLGGSTGKKPSINKVIVFVGGGERNGITKEESMSIWNIYAKHLGNVEILDGQKNPMFAAKEYAQANPQEEMVAVTGIRGEKDYVDLRRITTFKNAPNVQGLALAAAAGSGFRASDFRDKILSGNLDQITDYFPEALSSEEILSILTDLKDKIVAEILAGNIEGFLTEYFGVNEEVETTKEGRPEYTEQIGSILEYMLDQKMNILPLPGVKVRYDEENAENFFGKTAYYDPNSKEIVLYATGRHPKDICRSFTHEMIHHIQNIEGRLHNIQTQDTNDDKALLALEAEAYLTGNLTFRNWEDSIKNNKEVSETSSNKIVCNKCGWSWNKEDGGDDLYMCHKCGNDNTPPALQEKVSPELELQVKDYIQDYSEINVKLLKNLLKIKSKFPKELDPKSGGNKYGYRGTTFNKEFISKLKVKSESNGITEYEVTSNLKINSKGDKGFLSFSTDEDVARGFGHYSGYVDHKKSSDIVGGYVKVSLDNPNFILHPDYMGRLSQDMEYSKESEKETLYVGTSYSPESIYVVDKDIYKNENFIDGKKKGKSKPGRVKKSGASCKGSKSELRAKAKKYGGEKGKMYHWCANMKEEVMAEGKYDSIVTYLTGRSIEAIKNALTKKLHQYKEGHFGDTSKEDSLVSMKKELATLYPIMMIEVPEDITKQFQKDSDLSFDYDLKVMFVKGLDRIMRDGGAYKGGLDKDDSWEEPKIELEFAVDPYNFPRDFEEMSAQISDVLRHEIEHLTQAGGNERGKDFTGGDFKGNFGTEEEMQVRTLIQQGIIDNGVKYLTLPSEIDANIQGMYLTAKKQKRPFVDVVDQYLYAYTEQFDADGNPYLTKKDVEDVKRVWSLRLPALGIKQKL